MVRKRSFVLVTLGFPALIAAVIAVAFVFSTGGQDRRAAGYVDQAGVLRPSDVEAAGLVPFEDLDEATRALEAGEIQAVYMLPPDYRESGRVLRF
jgi:hypothetical protein